MNYTEMIEAALARGADFEQIAADFSKALNEKQKIAKEAEDRVRARTSYMSTLFANVEDWRIGDSDSQSVAVAADLATYEVAKDHENWDVNRLRQFAQDAKEQLEALVSLYEMEDQGDPFAKVLRKGLDIGSNKSKEKADDKDAESLLKFLRQLGL